MPHLCVPVLDGEAHAVLEAGAVRVADAGHVQNAFDNRVRELCPLEVVLNCRLAPAMAHPNNETSAGIHRGGVSVLADGAAQGHREGRREEQLPHRFLGHLASRREEDCGQRRAGQGAGVGGTWRSTFG